MTTSQSSISEHREADIPVNTRRRLDVLATSTRCGDVAGTSWRRRMFAGIGRLPGSTGLLYHGFFAGRAGMMYRSFFFVRAVMLHGRTEESGREIKTRGQSEKKCSIPKKVKISMLFPR